jgi:hypothetical protein
MSFYSKALYRDAALNWRGTGFGYLFLLLLICWIPPMAKLHSGLNGFVQNDAPEVVSQIPAITIANGEATADVPQPYYVVDPEAGERILAVDTTGSLNSLEDAEAPMLLTKTQFIFEKSDVETRTFDLSEMAVEEFAVDADRINRWLEIFARFFAVAVYPLAVLGSYVGRIVQLVIYAAIGMLFVAGQSAELTYAPVLRLAVIAVTPCIIIKTVLAAAGVGLPMAGLWYFLCAMGLLFFGVRAVAKGGETAEGS